MSKADVGDIWIWNKDGTETHYLLLERVEPPYDKLFKAMMLISNTMVTVNPEHKKDYVYWRKAA